MPDQFTNRGTNTQGNNWDTRQDSSGNKGYHYSNRDGSYHYQNTDGSKYHNDGQGRADYTTSSGDRYTYASKK